MLIKACEPCPYLKLGIDAEFSPQQFFVGASIPLELQARKGAQREAMDSNATLGGAQLVTETITATSTTPFPCTRRQRPWY